MFALGADDIDAARHAYLAGRHADVLPAVHHAPAEVVNLHVLQLVGWRRGDDQLSVGGRVGADVALYRDAFVGRQEVTTVAAALEVERVAITLNRCRTACYGIIEVERLNQLRRTFDGQFDFFVRIGIDTQRHILVVSGTFL